MTPTPNQDFEGELVLPSDPPVESRISRRLSNTKNKTVPPSSGGGIKAPSSPAQEEWEKELARLWGERYPHGPTSLYSEHHSWILAFISQTLASERKRLREEVEKMKIHWNQKQRLQFSTNPHDGYLLEYAHNKVLDQVLELLSDTTDKGEK